LLTIREMDEPEQLDAAIRTAFPGSRISITNDAGRCRLSLTQSGLLRPLGVEELSDGTLRYLLWVAALLTPRPPSLLVLNEPETSLHPDLLPALAQLVVAASTPAQVIAVSHSSAFVDAVARGARSAGVPAATIELTKEFGETRVAGRDGWAGQGGTGRIADVHIPARSPRHSCPLAPTFLPARPDIPARSTRHSCPLGRRS
jgi:predicted ATPase